MDSEKALPQRPEVHWVKLLRGEVVSQSFDGQQASEWMVAAEDQLKAQALALQAEKERADSAEAELAALRARPVETQWRVDSVAPEGRIYVGMLQKEHSARNYFGSRDYSGWSRRLIRFDTTSTVIAERKADEE